MVARRSTKVCRCPSSTGTQGEALDGGSSRLKFCSAMRSGSQRMGTLSLAAALRITSRTSPAACIPLPMSSATLLILPVAPSGGSEGGLLPCISPVIKFTANFKSLLTEMMTKQSR